MEGSYGIQSPLIKTGICGKPTIACVRTIVPIRAFMTRAIGEQIRAFARKNACFPVRKLEDSSEERYSKVYSQNVTPQNNYVWIA